jgi:hypothetical protein
VRSTPADADVLVNGKPRGKTPLALRDLALGSYTIRVEREGYAAEERMLQLTARRPTASTTFNLRSSARIANKTGPGLPAKPMGGAGLTAGGLNVQSARRLDASRDSKPACGTRNRTHRVGWLPVVDDDGRHQRGRADQSRGLVREK